MQVVSALLALGAAALAVAVVLARIVAPGVFAHVSRFRNPITLVLAATATAGSLYFSEVAHYVPCRLCWFQRVCMYPIAVVALVATIRRDRAARWYAAALAAVGLPISAYHYLIEWRPDLDTGSCSLFGPACTDIWFRTFGFATLAFMALCGFAAILAVNLTPDVAPDTADAVGAPTPTSTSTPAPARHPHSET